MKYQICRSLLLLGSFLFYLIPSFAQKLYTKDGVVFGERSAFIVPCVKGVQQKAIEIKGLKIDGELYCSCVADELKVQIESTLLGAPFKILNALGQEIIHGKLSKLNTSIDVGTLPQGSYNLLIGDAPYSLAFLVE